MSASTTDLASAIAPAARRRWPWVVAVALLLALGGAYVAATAALKAKVVAALGPDAEVARVALSWRGVVVEGLRLPAPRGWPSADALRAERVIVRPDLASLVSSRVRVAQVRLEQPYLSVQRTREGALKLLPGLLGKPRRSGGSPAAVTLDEVVVDGGVLEFFDASVRQPPHRLRLDEVQARLGAIELPALTARSPLLIDATVRGVRAQGHAHVDGWLVLATRESQLTTRLRGVDLVALEPYLIKSSETGVRSGTLDLDVSASVKARQLQAPGHLVLSQLELAPAAGGWSTFMGMPRQAVIASLKNRDNQIAVDFTLEGDLDSPRFSLNEVLSVRIAAGLAEGLGVSLLGVASGVGTLGQKSFEAIGKLFGGGDEPPPEKP